jgi:putative transposase
MARKLRLEYAGACYHVINRGNYRRNLFAAEGTAKSFEECLFEAAERFAWLIHAYVLMQNHFHLALETPEPNLSDGMQWLQSTWATRFNRFRGEVGRPFQGRYKALHVQPGHVLAQVAHYIHLNPVAAKLVPAERLLEYRCSSLSKFAGKRRPRCLVARTILAESGDLADSAAGWRRYVDYLGLVAQEDPKKREEKFGKLSRGWAALTAQPGATNRFELLGADGAACRELRAPIWEEALQQGAAALGFDLGNLGERKSSPAKVQLAALVKTATSVSNGWLAERLKVGQPASVSQFVRRFRLSGVAESRRFKQARSRVKACQLIAAGPLIASPPRGDSNCP